MIKKIIYIISIVSCSYLLAEQSKDSKQIKTDFTRDVLMPLGLPVVSSYHNMRENVLLNTKLKNGSWLESVGNWFLIPSRYLFAGKTVQMHGGTNGTVDYEIYPSFHYQKMHWFKTIAALAALPIAEVFGTTTKGLSYLSKKTRQRHRLFRQAIHKPLIKGNLEKYRQMGIDTFHCEETIPCQSHARPSQLLKKQRLEIQALKEISALFDAHNIIWWVDCGTCLGSYRYGGIIPWDWDIDIAILIDDHLNVKKLLSTLDPKKYQIQDWSSYTYPHTFLKLYLKETKNFLDIYHYQLNPEERTLAYFFTFKDSFFPQSWKRGELKCTKPVRYEEVFPLKKASFDGLTVWAPHAVVPFLQSKYGGNLDPAKVWDETTKTYKKVEGHPYNKED